MLRLRIELRYGYGFRTARYRVYDVGVVLDCNVHPLRLFVAVDAEHFAAVARAPEALERRGVEVCRPVNANKRHCIRTICNLCLSRRCFDSFGALERRQGQVCRRAAGRQNLRLLPRMAPWSSRKLPGGCSMPLSQ